MLHAAISGLGKAGTELIRTISDRNDIKVSAAFCRNNSERTGKDIGTLARIHEMGVKAVDITDAEKVLSRVKADVVMDFSSPDATKQLLPVCKRAGIPAVVCTTGFSDDEMLWMRNLVSDKSFGLIYAPNVTIGINVLIAALKIIANALPFFDYQITETHHSRKSDIPSGTAKKISQVLKSELHLEFNDEIPINSIRAGGYVGVHEVMAAGDFERLTITHESFSRRAFANGAIQAAKYILHRKGWFEMSDVVNQCQLINIKTADPRIILPQLDGKKEACNE